MLVAFRETRYITSFWAARKTARLPRQREKQAQTDHHGQRRLLRRERPRRRRRRGAQSNDHGRRGQGEQLPAAQRAPRPGCARPVSPRRRRRVSTAARPRRQKTTAAPSAAGAPQAQVRFDKSVHAPGRQEGHGPARRRVASGPQGRRGAAARGDHEDLVPRAADAGGLARLGHAEREHAALLPFSWFVSGPVRGRGGRARSVPRRGTWT